MTMSRPFQAVLRFDTGSLTPFSGSFVRRLGDMKHAYADQTAVAAMLEAGNDPIIYSGYDADVPDEDGHLVFRTTIINAGLVGAEFYMTKGHHHVRDSAELYVGMTGEGLMIMETRQGDSAREELVPYASVYVPPGWSHRTVNTGGVPLAFLAVYFGNAGHDYESIERTGFATRVFRGDHGPEFRHDADRGDLAL